jgi:hypothetical protein
MNSDRADRRGVEDGDRRECQQDGHDQRRTDLVVGRGGGDDGDDPR